MDQQSISKGKPVATALVSVIIPAYNRAAIISETLNSVKAQTWQNWECIVVDDGSVDNTAEIAERYTKADARFRYLPNQLKKGAPGARNTGVEESRGDFLIFLDSDDLLSPDCLSNRINKFKQNPDFDFLVFSSIEFKERIDDTNILVNVLSKENTIKRFLNLDMPWLIMAAIWRRESFLKLGQWNEELLSWQDWDLHIRAVFNGYKFTCFSTVDNYYRCNSSITSLGTVAITKEHLACHLKMITALKQLMGADASYRSQLNGLIYWVAEKSVEQGDMALARKALISSHEDLHWAKKIINLSGLTFFKKLLIKHPRMPGFGSYRKFISNT